MCNHSRKIKRCAKILAKNENNFTILFGCSNLQSSLVKNPQNNFRQKNPPKKMKVILSQVPAPQKVRTNFLFLF
jgi:hypothetical protein